MSTNTTADGHEHQNADEPRGFQLGEYLPIDAHETLEGPSLKGRHLLVVDNEAPSRELLQLILSREDAKVVVAATEGEALNALNGAIAFDALVCDLGLPGGARHLLAAAAQRHIPVLGLVAAGEPKVQTAWLEKPVKGLEMLRALAAMLKSGPKR